MAGLVLTRREGETVEVGDNVRVTVVSVKGERVRLHFDAPTSVAINRKEVADAIRAERAAEREIGGGDGGVRVDSVSGVKPGA